MSWAGRFEDRRHALQVKHLKLKLNLRLRVYACQTHTNFQEAYGMLPPMFPFFRVVGLTACASKIFDQPPRGQTAAIKMLFLIYKGKRRTALAETRGDRNAHIQIRSLFTILLLFRKQVHVLPAQPQLGRIYAGCFLLVRQHKFLERFEVGQGK